jgi:transposase-like protein
VDASLPRHRGVIEPNSPRESPASLPKIIRNTFPDDFFEKVASAYSEFAAVSNSPIVQLARANDVPPSTAHRWIKEARRLGLIAARDADSHRGREPSTPEEMLAFFGDAIGGSDEARAAR